MRLPNTSSFRRTLTLASLILGVAALGQGCFERRLAPIAPCARSTVQDVQQIAGTDQVDLLFMIDNSGSMSQEQQAIRAQIPRMVGILTSGVCSDGTHFTPARSLHIGVVSSDMGVGSAPTNLTCHSAAGQDGILRSQGATGACAAPSSSIFDFRPETDPTAFAGAVSCVAQLGTDGCGFEQQLESVLKALSPSAPTTWTARGYAPPTFWGASGPTFGHGGPEGLNDGFLRPNSVLAIVLLTDEDDCSAADSALYDVRANAEVRCSDPSVASMLQSAERYVDGLRALRTDPSRLVFAAIVGVPTSAAADHLTEDQILHMDDMANRVTGPNALQESCHSANGVAYAPRRIVEVARGLREQGARTTIQSICATDFGPAVDDILVNISTSLGAACLGRPLNPDASGEVTCTVLELLPAIEGSEEFRHCEDLPNADAYELERIELETIDGVQVSRELCRVRQVGRAGAGSVAGWYYDDGDARLGAASALEGSCAQRVAFSIATPAPGAEVRLRCDETIFPDTQVRVQLGSFCQPGTGADGAGLVSGSGGLTCAAGIATPGFAASALSCDAFDRTCQVRCTASSDCTVAGLLGYVCDDRVAAEVFGVERPMDLPANQVHGVCVNPTCAAR